MPLFGGYKTHYVVPSLCRTRTVQSDPCHVDTIAGDYFLGLCDQKSSYKHVSGFGRWRGCGYFLIHANALRNARRKAVRNIEPAGGWCNQRGGLSLALQAFFLPTDSLKQLANILVVKYDN